MDSTRTPDSPSSSRDMPVPPGRQDSPRELGLLERIWGVLASPRIVFAYLRERPRLLGALLVLVVLYIASGYILSDLTYREQVTQLQARGNLTEEQQLAAAEKMRIGVKVVGPLAGGLFAAAAVFVVGGILLFLGNVVLGGDARYKVYAAATAHTFLVGIPAMAVKIPLSLATDTLRVQTSLAAFLPAGMEKTLPYFALAQLDLFGLWQLGLTALAVGIVARVPGRKAALVVIGAWLVWSAIWVPLQTLLARLGAHAG